MQRLPESLDEGIVSKQFRWIRLRVPLRLEDKELDQAFNQFLRKKTESFWTGTLVMLCLGMFVSAASYWEDWHRIVTLKGRPWNFLVAVPSACSLLLTVAVLLYNHKAPTFFTENVRLGLIALQVSRFTLFSRPIISFFFDVDSQYAASMTFAPHSTWVVFVCIVVTTVSCQTARCTRSFIMCFYCLVLILAYSFSLPQGREAVHDNIRLVLTYIVHALICFYGQAASELLERRFFLSLHSAQTDVVQERVKRYQAERKADNPQVILAAPSDDHASSRKGTQASEAASSNIFQALHAGSDSVHATERVLTNLELLGEEEHWLIKSEELHLHPDWNLGVGGFGNVVVGTWMASQVAVKVPQSSDRGIHPLAFEMRHLRKLRHPCIVSFLGICLTEDRSNALLIEEWVDGDNLEMFMVKLGAVTSQCVQFRQHVLLDISAALFYLHSQPSAIVHGDLKPGNVIIDRRSLTAKLTDFGHARRAFIDEILGGTPLWLEPKIRKRRPKGGVQCSTDIWAFGCIAFFVCTGVVPWKGRLIRGSSSMEKLGAAIFDLWRGDADDKLAAQAKKGRTVYLNSSEDVAILSVVCHRCMAADPRLRPTAGDVNKDLKSWRNMTCRSNNGGALSQTCANSSLSEQVAAVRARAREHSTSAPMRLDLRPEMLIHMRDVLRQQIECLRALPASDLQSASSVIQMVLAAVIEQCGSDYAVISL